MEDVRQFYQVYRDAIFLSDLFGIETSEVSNVRRFYERVFAAIFNLLARRSEFRAISASDRQIRILTDENIEVKIARFNRCFLQVSATNMYMATEVFEEIIKEVQKIAKEADA